MGNVSHDPTKGKKKQDADVPGQTAIGFTVPAWMNTALLAIKADGARSVTSVLREACREFFRVPPTTNQVWTRVVESRARARSEGWAVGRPSLQKGVGAVHLRFYLDNDLCEKMEAIISSPPATLRDTTPSRLSKSFIMRMIIERDLITRGILREIE
jgi:hypothetical protein